MQGPDPVIVPDEQPDLERPKPKYHPGSEPHPAGSRELRRRAARATRATRREAARARDRACSNRGIPSPPCKIDFFMAGGGLGVPDVW